MNECGSDESNGIMTTTTRIILATTFVATLGTPVLAGVSCGGSERPRVLDLSDATTAASVFGADRSDLSGDRSAVAVGDLNGDGLGDLILGAHRGDGPDGRRPESGEVHVLFGPLSPGDAADLAAGDSDLVIHGPRSGDTFGWSIAAADLDGDGLDDLAIGAPLTNGPGRRTDSGAVHVLLGPLPAGTRDLRVTPADVIVHGAFGGDRLGHALALGDVTGDGIGDLAAGAREADGPSRSRPSGGEVHVLAGPLGLATARVRDLRSDAADAVIQGASSGDRLGESLAIGDLNGDGILDLALSSVESGGLADARNDAGEVHALFGPLSPGLVVDLASDLADTEIHGGDSNDELGFDLAIADVDGDGEDDLLMGAPSADGPANGRPNAGEVHVLLGPLSGALVVDLAVAPADLEVRGSRAADRLGFSLDAGDVSADGVADLILGAVGSDGPNVSRGNAGAVLVVEGGAGVGVIDLAADTPLVIVHGANVGDQLGWAVAAGELSSDGIADLAVAAPTADGALDGRSSAGDVYVAFGVETGCFSVPELQGVPADVVASCDDVPPPAVVGVTDECDPDPVLTFRETRFDGACPGDYQLVRTWRAENRCGEVDERRQVVSVKDVDAPEVTTSEEELLVLWPPNHRMVRFTREQFSPEVADSCSSPVSWRFVDCASDQPDDALGDGSTDGDCVVEAGGGAFSVRSERAGVLHSARHYAVTVVAADACGNESDPTVIGLVTVRFSRGVARRVASR